MSTILVGCWRVVDGKLLPVWINPCTSEEMIGCLDGEAVPGGLFPRYLYDIGACAGPFNGCLTEGLAPGLYIPDYCCCGEVCQNCDGGVLWSDNMTPTYIWVTFAGIERCLANECYPTPVPLPMFNGTWLLTQVPGYNTCQWMYEGTEDGIDLTIVLEMGGDYTSLYAHRSDWGNEFLVSENQACLTELDNSYLCCYDEEQGCDCIPLFTPGGTFRNGTAQITIVDCETT